MDQPGNSERQRAIDALGESEEQWREVFEHNPVMYFMVDAGGTVLSVNGFGAEHLGYAASELLGQSVLTVFFEEDREIVKAHVATCLGELGRSHSWEIRKVRKDGTTLWVRENAKAIRRPRNDVIVLVACEDITERRHAEQRRDAMHAVTRILAEADSLDTAAPNLVQSIGESLEWDWGALWTFARAFGGQGTEMRCRALWHAPDLEAPSFDSITRERILMDGQGRRGEVWQLGAPVWIANAPADPEFLRASAAAQTGLHAGVIFPILLEREVLGMVEFFSREERQRDEEQLATLSAIGSQIGQFIKRRRAEMSVRAGEERWRRLFETSVAGMALLTLEGIFTAANPAFQRMLGRPEKAIVGRRVEEMTHERAETEALIARFKSGAQQEYHVEKRYLKADGSPVWLNITTTLVPPTDLTAPLLQSIYIDITERKRTEEALQQAQADLARVNRILLLGELTASIAHEVAQPIAGVITNANSGLRWLATRPPDLDEARLALERILRDGNRAGEVIHRVRGMAKKLPTRRDRSDLNEVIRETLALTQAELQRNRIDLQVQLADGVPPVAGDRVQLQQVIINLVMNAIEAMEGHGNSPRKLTISSGIGSSNDVFVEVQDTGPGFGPADRDRLFQSFYTTKPEGTGLGLAISRSIIEAHGGRIWATANQPRGAVVQFTLPREAGPLDKNQAD